MNENDFVADFLSDCREKVNGGCESEAIEAIRRAVTEMPQIVDCRLNEELHLIEDLIATNKLLKNSEYDRSFELVYKYCQLRYGNLDFSSDIQFGSDLPDKDKIWWCWLQGIDEAPMVARCCLESLNILNRDIVLLDNNNLFDYISLPEYIIDEYKRGIIDPTHFSDLVRIALLTERGGMWVDTTVYLSAADTLLDVMDSGNLFAFRSILSDSTSRYATYSNWLIYATKRSRILEMVKQMLFAYWENETELKHYYLFHIIFNIACERYRDEEAKIPIFSNEPCHIMQSELFHPYDEHRYRQICRMSDVHKLTYKFDKDANINGTLLEKILQMKE